MPRPALGHVLRLLRDHVCAGRWALSEEAWLDLVHRGVSDEDLEEAVLGGSPVGWVAGPSGASGAGTLRSGGLGVSFRVDRRAAVLTGVFFMETRSTLFALPADRRRAACGEGSKSLRARARVC
ncbi:MAG TPA: hypothetical protein VNO22_12900 [Planctomycetota bacterium]|jgi:hypothetical protein|nr:hypothetical protein [Planctomycetota bacterium]